MQDVLAMQLLVTVDQGSASFALNDTIYLQWLSHLLLELFFAAELSLIQFAMPNTSRRLH